MTIPGAVPSLTAVTILFQRVTSFTHKLAHRKTKFVRIFIACYRWKLCVTGIVLLQGQDGDCTLILAAKSCYTVKEDAVDLDLDAFYTDGPRRLSSTLGEPEGHKLARVCGRLVRSQSLDRFNIYLNTQEGAGTVHHRPFL